MGNAIMWFSCGRYYILWVSSSVLQYLSQALEKFLAAKRYNLLGFTRELSFWNVSCYPILILGKGIGALHIIWSGGINIDIDALWFGQVWPVPCRGQWSDASLPGMYPGLQ